MNYGRRGATHFQAGVLHRAGWIVAAVMGLSGCAPKGLYDWGSYEDSLYSRYTDNDFIQAEAYVSESLPTAAHPMRVPPGVYADYGFLLYRRGDYAGALEYFEKEKSTYPESSALMTKLIGKVREKAASPAPGGSAAKEAPEPKREAEPRENAAPKDNAKAGVTVP